ncbi:uncharacterized protein DUF1127 [Rhodobacter aestuarii]|uniref:YjiS-like domain-containing protein n=1 Tax=Rhodobacter aestuarii TaxID=453582 RepID=A0A1N7MB53_9RHOB|nr:MULTISPECIES: DUF1127 domain-containing protein [Rhodobacter]PTV94965.1 uncharacterized protein DUF1127 [Rhodobacter aestuarii]SIS83262.1 protein of unknown function [Rhodobacter aestuarii]SOB97791.1 uncharacterized protein DUF1127 [Rhodobacter sp. JA431]
MSGLSTAAALSYPSLTLSHRPAALRPGAAVLRLVLDWMTLRTTARAMDRLDDHMRRDIGLGERLEPPTLPHTFAGF